MTTPNETLKDIAIRLFKINAVKFGSFTTQSGAVTPFYFDLRVIISYPGLMKELGDHLSKLVNSLIEEAQKRDPETTKVLLCGIPYAALPIATVVSVKTDLPMIMKRKEAKNYGTNKVIEGEWTRGDKCILIDDVLMFGNTVLEISKELNDAGLKCSQAVVILDRQQGAVEKLRKNGIEVKALLTSQQIMDSLLESNYITNEIYGMVKDYLAANQVTDVFKECSCDNKKI